MKKLIKQLMRVLYTLVNINLFKFFKSYSNTSSTVILLNKHWKRPAIEILIWELASIRFFIENETPFRLSFTRNCSKFKNKNIFWYPSLHFVEKTKNHTEKLIEFAIEIEQNGNFINPSSKQVAFLENKGFMYKQFSDKKISHPNTKLIAKSNFDHSVPFEFPFLVKGEYSSSGKEVVLISNKNNWLSYLESTLFKKSDTLIFQELIDMRFDIRVVVVGDKVVNHYWRKNPSKEWKPTSTSYGSYLDFSPLPQNVIKITVEYLEKLGLKMGAYDITFQNDDIKSQPLVLEISPLFSLNPMIEGATVDNYAKYKTKLFGKNVFWKDQIDQIFLVNEKYLKLFKL